MRINKLQHATLVLEEGAQRLVIDPGSFTPSLGELDGVQGVVITHEHADHWTPEHLRTVLEANPGARIFGPAGVAAAASGFDVTVVAPGDEATAGEFRLRFFGGRHAVIHSSIPVVENLGVLVNDTLYYPGDSFAVPEGVDVDVLATPASGPWLKDGEVIDYVRAVKPRRSFPVHESINSEAGNALANSRIEWAAQQNGGVFFPMNPGDHLDA